MILDLNDKKDHIEVIMSDIENTRMDFEVYIVYKCTDGSYVYQDKTSLDIHLEFNENCRKIFEGLIEWRGYWESRLYFTDYEYWGFEIGLMSEAYNIILPIIKQKIIDNNIKRFPSMTLEN